QLPKTRDLPLQLGAAVAGDAGAAVGAAHELDMETETQVRGRGSQRRRVLARERVDHQARAGEDPSTMCLEDPSIDAGAHPEVVAVDDQVPHRNGRPSLLPAHS